LSQPRDRNRDQKGDIGIKRKTKEKEPKTRPPLKTDTQSQTRSIYTQKHPPSRANAATKKVKRRKEISGNNKKRE
jgi:hypothetical protein